jgi:hypothetical protein
MSVPVSKTPKIPLSEAPSDELPELLLVHLHHLTRSSTFYLRLLGVHALADYIREATVDEQPDVTRLRAIVPFVPVIVEDGLAVCVRFARPTAIAAVASTLQLILATPASGELLYPFGRAVTPLLVELFRLLLACLSSQLPVAGVAPFDDELFGGGPLPPISPTDATVVARFCRRMVTSIALACPPSKPSVLNAYLSFARQAQRLVSAAAVDSAVDPIGDEALSPAAAELAALPSELLIASLSRLLSDPLLPPATLTCSLAQLGPRQRALHLARSTVAHSLDAIVDVAAACGSADLADLAANAAESALDDTYRTDLDPEAKTNPARSPTRTAHVQRHRSLFSPPPPGGEDGLIDIEGASSPLNILDRASPLVGGPIDAQSSHIDLDAVTNAGIEPGMDLLSPRH